MIQAFSEDGLSPVRFDVILFVTKASQYQLRKRNLCKMVQNSWIGSIDPHFFNDHSPEVC